MKFKIVGFIYSLLLWNISFCQKTLSGKVTDKQTGQPLSGVSVYIANTSAGAVTNSKGEYVINQVTINNFELIASIVGYETTAANIAMNVSDQQNFSLVPKVNELEEVVVGTYEKDGWEKWGRLFLENFIGTSDIAKGCTIKNYKAVRFRYFKQKDQLTAYAMEPLIIENRSLGYTIRYDLIKFSSDFKSGYVLYAGYPLFTEMKGGKAKIKKWKANRSNAYYGSMLQFMRAMYRNKVPEFGFEMRRLEKLPNLEKQRVRAVQDFYIRVVVDKHGVKQVSNDMEEQLPPDTLKYYKEVLQQKDVIEVLHPEVIKAETIAYAENDVTAVMDFKDYLLVTYPAKKEEPGYYEGRLGVTADPYITSAITLINNRPVKIQSNGSYYDSQDLMSSGYWGWHDKMGTMLPLDYKEQ
ncbi:carboxypeptidase-like regulatory domain-containing protein [Danxiaibacter flavus]|uniref:Carboxypeptidase-like regulatory domain-containing protein n=1 Tax=Danxiaibacter flavus TaxID=3049108 RepID=A0ABV3ZDK4_9BACT|nr:carboxypeptidase-like regulatory domain-containing protein [Chitinophagaceae bacterium DXS]